MGVSDTTRMDEEFLSLSLSERKAIISHGTALRLSDLRKRLFLAENKVRYFEEKYGTTLSLLENTGLPNEAGYEMHEDYIMWRHWAGAAEKAKEAASALERIARHGLFLEETVRAGD
jgi:hypothetical protein